MENTSSRIIRCLLAGVLSAGLYSSGLFLIFAPMPFFYLTLHHKNMETVLASITAFLCVVAFYYLSSVVSLPIPGMWFIESVSRSSVPVFLFSLFYFGFFASVGLSLGTFARYRLPLEKWTGFSLVIAILVLMSGIVTLNLTGISIIKPLNNIINEFISTASMISQKAGNSFQADLINQYKDQISTVIIYLIPSIIFSFSVLIVAVNVIIGRRLMLTGHLLKHIHNVASFRTPDVLIWIPILSGVLFFVDSYFLHKTWPTFIALNFLIASASVYLWQGVAILSYFLQKISGSFFKIFTYIIIIMFFQTIAGLLVLLGISDVWIDFRRRARIWRRRRNDGSDFNG